MKEEDKNLDDWIKLIKKIEGLRYSNFAGIKISDTPMEKKIRDSVSNVITDKEIQLLIRILRKVSILPNKIYPSHGNTHLVLSYNYDANHSAVFLINSEVCKYSYTNHREITPYREASETGIVSEINNTIQVWKDKLSTPK